MEYQNLLQIITLAIDENGGKNHCRKENFKKYFYAFLESFLNS